MSIAGFVNSKRDNIDLVLFSCGRENCKPHHSYGPAVREHYLIHYVIEGEGTFHVDGKVYKLSKNQGFVIYPNVLTYYEADETSPWYYNWVGFRGFKAETYLKQAGLSKINPIFTYNKGDTIETIVNEMINYKSPTEENELKLHGLLFLFMAELVGNAEKQNIADNGQKDLYIKKCIEYIEKNFSHDISISDLAEYIGLNRSYLSSIFKSYINMSPQEFLIRYRMDKASEFMLTHSLSISEISRSVGYEDPLAFSKIFKKIKGSSPREFRESMIKK
jgi:AraC-like DNA-binding protein